MQADHVTYPPPTQAVADNRVIAPGVPLMVADPLLPRSPDGIIARRQRTPRQRRISGRGQSRLEVAAHGVIARSKDDPLPDEDLNRRGIQEAGIYDSSEGMNMYKRKLDLTSGHFIPAHTSDLSVTLRPNLHSF